LLLAFLKMADMIDDESAVLNLFKAKVNFRNVQLP